MLHTYRDPDLNRTFFDSGSLAAYLFVLILVLGVFPALGSSLWFCAVTVGFLVVHQSAVYWAMHSGWCSEIRLRDDGTCEFEAKRRTIRLHVGQIRSVAYWGEESSESFSIHYEGGRLRVASKMTDFRDFLTRLKTLNPAVEFRSFPADDWPEFCRPATEEPAPGVVGRFVRSGIFPFVVISLLVYLVSKTV